MKIWLDDLRPAPEGYEWCRSVCEARSSIIYCEYMNRYHDCSYKVELIDCDHDLGDYAREGGDAIKLLDWLEATDRNYPIRIHTMNPVGRERMRAVIQHNHWKEIQ